MRILEQEPLSAHTTFRIGGPASFYMIPENAEEIREGIHFAKEREFPFITIGRGSNMLFPDEGYHGVVIEIGSGMNEIEYSGAGKIRAQAGALLSAIASEAARHSLTGFEFAGGIPGTLGGAVVMNAGAYGGEIKDCIVSARVMDSAGNESILSREQLELGYRTSVIQSRGDLVLEAEFQFEPGDPREIRERMKELNAKRRDKQPLEFASAGSTFKRPEGHFAGKLIEDAGLRGYRIGDAQVSEKHCGFVVNRGHATAKEVLAVICDVQKKVLESSGVKLEPEVKIIR
ncbi:MAG: UDP-N-acetylmuramate dehydrogenase [Eubacterium sp.]|nr:UDP-N-acetylmuramate dehydrogenase [Eubacterium sp.]